jgi:TetR/AcrR family transcriptional regulator, regulator of cefoperazone and chloramphenicol sensitivity
MKSKATDKAVRTLCSTGRLAYRDRGEQTRRRLIEVAIEGFSKLGYEGASTRAIVGEAEANLVAIPYYFGSKLGLYLAVAEYIGSNIAERFRPACDRAREGLLQERLTHQEALQKFTDFIVEFAEIMLSEETPRSWGQFIYRELLDPTEAIELLHARFLPLLEVGCEYVSRLTKRPVESPETLVQFMAILSMVQFTRLGGASVLRNTGWQSFGEEETRIVIGLIRHNMQALFARSD